MANRIVLNETSYHAQVLLLRSLMKQKQELLRRLSYVQIQT